MIPDMPTWIEIEKYKISRIVIADSDYRLGSEEEKRVEVFMTHDYLPTAKITLRYQHWPSKEGEKEIYILIYSTNSAENHKSVMLPPSLSRKMKNMCDAQISKVLQLLPWS